MEAKGKEVEVEAMEVERTEVSWKSDRAEWVTNLRQGSADPEEMGRKMYKEAMDGTDTMS